MNYLIGKIGRSIYFDKRKWSMYAGDEEAPLLYTMLARRHPEDKFFLIGRSDIKKARASGLDIPDNIVDMFNDIPSGIKDCRKELCHWMLKKVTGTGLKFDAGIIYQGPEGGINVPGVGTKTVMGELHDAKCLLMFEVYAAPIYHTLNMTGVPYFLINGDPRYIPKKSRDILNDEKFILSQINITKYNRRIAGGKYESQEYRMAENKFKYAGVETVFLLDEPKIDFRNMKKSTKFVMGLNGGGDRQGIVEEWLLNDPNHREGMKIYGKWEKSFTSKWPGVFEECAIKNVEFIFWDSKYTFIPPFFKKLPGFVTQKFWKMLYYGIIPFFHPKYDVDKLFDVPEILRVNTPKEMWDRIEHLETHKDEYDKILDHIYGLLADKYFNGDHLNDTVMNAVASITKEH